MFDKLSRLLPWLVISVLLSVAALYVQATFPGNVIAVTLYKMHLLSLAGWAGYWLDRALFPYDRPHSYLDETDQVPEPEPVCYESHPGEAVYLGSTIAHNAFGMAMIRRAIIVAAALIGVCLGA